MNLLCLVGKHRLQLVAVDYGFRVEFAKDQFMVQPCWFYRCDRCGKRIFDTTYFDYKYFPAMLAAKKNWEINALIPDRAGLPSDFVAPPTQKTAEIIPFRVVKDDDN